MATDHPLCLFVCGLLLIILDNISHGVLDQWRRYLLVFDEPKAPVNALFLLSFYPSSHLIITPAEYISRRNRYSNGGAAWVISGREMRERL